jgi:hypothetical protein
VGLVKSLALEGSAPPGTHARVLEVIIGKLGEDPRCTSAVEGACLDVAAILADLQAQDEGVRRSVWPRLDGYQLRRLTGLGRHTNVSPRFIAERNREEKPKIMAAVRAVLKRMPRRRSNAFDPEHWAKLLVKEIRKRIRPVVPRPLGDTRGAEWWSIPVARKMLFGDISTPTGKADAHSAADATHWLLAQLYGHGTIDARNWKSYVSRGEKERKADRRALARMRRRRRKVVK